MEIAAVAPPEQISPIRKRTVFILTVFVVLGITLLCGYALWRCRFFFGKIGSEIVPEPSLPVRTGFLLGAFLFPWGWLVPTSACAVLSLLAARGTLDRGLRAGAWILGLWCVLLWVITGWVLFFSFRLAEVLAGST